MNDVLDDQLRTLMTTAVRDAPAAPPAGVLGIVEVRAEAPARRHRPLLIAAAAVAVVVAGVVVAGRPAVEVEPADTTPTSVPPRAFLDAYYLPSELPDGWRIIEATRTPAPAQTDRAGNVVVFERRDHTDRVMVSLEPLMADPTQSTLAAEEVANTEFPPSVTAPSPADSAASADWSDDTRTLSWTVDGQLVMLTARSGDEAAARQLAVSLVVTSTDHGRSFDVDPASDWVRLREYLLDGETLLPHGSNALTIGTASGASIAVSIQHDGPTSVLDMAIPAETFPGVYDYSPGGATPGTASLDGDVAIVAFALGEPSVSLDELRQLVFSMRRVTVEEWDAAAPDVETLLESSPIVSRFSALGYDVTVHVDGALRGICIAKADVSGCARFGGIDEAGRVPAAMPTTGIALSDGSWVAVGSIGVDRTVCGDDQLAGAAMAVATNGDQTVAILVPADSSVDFGCLLQGPDGVTEPFIAMAPVP